MMKRKICTIILTALICSLFSACKISKPEAVKTIDMVQETVQSEKELPKSISLALVDAKSLHPYNEQNLINLQALKLVYEPLFTYDENMRAVPVLAESFTVSDGGKTITVKLKNNIKWHDGKTLTANDVIYTVNLILSENTAYSKGVISRAEVLDKQTVRINFFKPQMNAKEQLMFPIVKSGADSIIGTGPFMLSGKQSADTYGFSQFLEYHGEKPEITDVKMINTPDAESVVRLFDIGETDILTSDAFDYATFNVRSDMSVYDYPINSFVYMGINFENSVFWGESSRQALLYILDKETIVEKTMYKKAEVSDFPINPSSWLYPSELDYKKDSKKAEELLFSNSWTRVDGVFARMIDGKRQNFKVRMIVKDDEELKLSAEIIEKNLDNFGIECSVLVKSEEEFLHCIQNKEYDIFIDRASLSGSTDFESLTGDGNIFGYLNSSLNTIVEQIRTEQDDTVLKQKISECCEIFLKDVQFIPLYFYKDAVAAGRNISKNIVPGLDNPFYNIAAWNR